MKKLSTIIVLCLMCFTFVLVGCTGKGFKDNPKTNEEVLGNGSFSVQKGDYLYFTNGADEYENATNKAHLGALYRAKLNNGKAQVDDEKYITNAQLMVSRVVGYKFGGFYIFGDYIYYATPVLGKDKKGNSLKDHIEFRRIKINGTSDTSIYTTSNSFTEKNWNAICVDGNVYIVVLDGTKLVSIKANGSTSTTTISDNVSNFKIYKAQDYYASDKLSDTQKFVYYTKSVTNESDSSVSYVLAKSTLNKVEETVLKVNPSEAYAMVGVTVDKIYYTNNGILYSRDNNGKENVVLSYTYNTLDFIDDYILVNANNVLYITDNNGNEIGTINTKISNVLYVRNSYIYYLKDNNLYVSHITDTLSNGRFESRQIALDSSVKLNTTKGFLAVCSGRYLSMLSDIEGSDGTTRSYLIRIDTMTDQEMEITSVLKSGHKPKNEA